MNRVLHASLALLIGGCCPRLFTPPDTPISDAADLLKRNRDHGSRIVSIELLTRMSWYADSQARKGTVEVLARRPSKVRFEALDPAGANTVAVMISDGERFTSHERGQADCFTGEACRENIARLLPLAFEGEQLFDALVGTAPIILHETATGGWDECQGAYEIVLSRAADETVQELWLRPDSFAAIRTKVTRAGQLLYELTWDDFEPVDAIPFPRRVHFESPERDTDLSVKVREVYLNSVDTDEPFAPACPSGTTHRELRCP